MVMGEMGCSIEDWMTANAKLYGNESSHTPEIPMRFVET